MYVLSFGGVKGVRKDFLAGYKVGAKCLMKLGESMSANLKELEDMVNSKPIILQCLKSNEVIARTRDGVEIKMHPINLLRPTGLKHLIFSLAFR